MADILTPEQIADLVDTLPSGTLANDATATLITYLVVQVATQASTITKLQTLIADAEEHLIDLDRHREACLTHREICIADRTELTDTANALETRTEELETRIDRRRTEIQELGSRVRNQAEEWLRDIRRATDELRSEFRRR